MTIREQGSQAHEICGLMKPAPLPEAVNLCWLGLTSTGGRELLDGGTGAGKMYFLAERESSPGHGDQAWKV